MFVERRAVEVRQSVNIGREMRRHPIDDHADAGFVAAVDEACEGFRGAKARRRCELAQRLVAPRAAERMLGNRQQLDVAEAHACHVGNQAFAQFVPVQFAPVLVA